MGTWDVVLVERAASLVPPLRATSLAVGLHEWYLLFVQRGVADEILVVLVALSLVVSRLLPFPLILQLLLQFLMAFELKVLVNGDLSWPVHLQSEQEWGSLFRLEDNGLLGHDVQDCVIAH